MISGTRNKPVQRKPVRCKQGGFTLLEIIVVVLIVALLMGIVGPNVMQRLGETRSDAAKLQIQQFGAALDLYKLDIGRYPTSDEGLQALVEQPGEARNWKGPYTKKNTLPKDPWGNDYRYSSPGEHGSYDLFSMGADGGEGGEGENRDITSWE